jgi:hypothetical protein
MELDRREFLKGSLAAAGGVAAAAALGGCATGVAAAGSASAAADWYGKPANPASFTISETVDTDLLICGCGGAGIVATAVAAEQKVKALTIEKMPVPGTVRSFLGVVGAKSDAGTGIKVDPNTVVLEHTRYTNGWCNPAVVNTWVKESGATFDWLCDTVAEFGATPYFETDVGDGTHGNWPVYPTDHGFNYAYTPEEMARFEEITRTNPDPAAAVSALPNFGTYLLRKAAAWGAQIRYNTALVQLLKDGNGKVTGAIAKSDGKYIRINASKGVLLATGGYEANHELLAKLNPQAASITGFPMFWPGSTGDGIIAGLWAGGVKDEIPTLMTFSRAAIGPDMKLGYPYTGATCWMGDQPFPRVNLRGERVCCETSPYDYPLFVAAQQPECKVATIWDANYKEHIRAFHTIGCSRIDPSKTKTPAGKLIGSGMTFEVNDGMIMAAKAAGIIQSADTIEELATKMHIDPAGLKATITRYNAMAARGVDEDFGKPAKHLIALNTPPYSAAFFGGHVLCTLDGLKIDKDMRVLGKDKQPIEGLYAVGNCSGSMYAGSYPELFIGNCMGRNMTHARHAVLYIKGKA